MLRSPIIECSSMTALPKRRACRMKRSPRIVVQRAAAKPSLDVPVVELHIDVGSLSPGDLDPRRGSLLVRRGKGGRAARSAWTPGAGSNSIHGSR